MTLVEVLATELTRARERTLALVDFDDAELGHVGSSPARSTPLVASLPIQPGSAIALPCGDDGEGNLTGFKTEPATRKQRKVR